MASKRKPTLKPPPSKVYGARLEDGEVYLYTDFTKAYIDLADGDQDAKEIHVFEYTLIGPKTLHMVLE